MSQRTAIAPGCLLELFAAAEYLLAADEAVIDICPTIVSPERRRRASVLRAMITHVKATNGRPNLTLKTPEAR